MHDDFAWLLRWLANINWLEIIKTLASVATAIIAFRALKNWQRQDKAKREAELLDALLDAAHAYLAAMYPVVTLLGLNKIAMASYASKSGGDGQAIKGAIAYIEKNGEHDSQRLRDALDEIRPVLTKLQSLAAKGQIFNFVDYVQCQNAVTQFGFQFGRIEAFTAIIGSTTMNWENLEVVKHVEIAMAIDPIQINKMLTLENVALLEFAKVAYKRLYSQ